MTEENDQAVQRVSVTSIHTTSESATHEQHEGSAAAFLEDQEHVRNSEAEQQGEDEGTGDEGGNANSRSDSRAASDRQAVANFVLGLDGSGEFLVSGPRPLPREKEEIRPIRAVTPRQEEDSSAKRSARALSGAHSKVSSPLALHESDAAIREKKEMFHLESVPSPRNSKIPSVASSRSATGNEEGDENDDELPPPALSRQTGRDTVPEIQPGAVAVQPGGFASDRPNVGSTDRPGHDRDHDGHSADHYESDDSSSRTPELPNSLLIPEATPIRASIVRKEEESNEKLLKLEREMAAKLAEMAAMKARLAEMERYHSVRSSTTSHESAFVEPVAVVAEPLKKRDATLPNDKNKISQKDNYKDMSSAEFHAFQVLMGKETSAKNNDISKKKDKRNNSTNSDNNGIPSQKSSKLGTQKKTEHDVNDVAPNLASVQTSHGNTTENESTHTTTTGSSSASCCTIL